MRKHLSFKSHQPFYLEVKLSTSLYLFHNEKQTYTPQLCTDSSRFSSYISRYGYGFEKVELFVIVLLDAEVYNL